MALCLKYMYGDIQRFALLLQEVEKPFNVALGFHLTHTLTGATVEMPMYSHKKAFVHQDGVVKGLGFAVFIYAGIFSGFLAFIAEI